MTTPHNGLPAIHPGQPVRIDLPSAPDADGPVVTGTVRQLAPTVDPKTRFAIVYVDLPRGGAARAGMVSLTDVEVTPDYAHAKVFFTTLAAAEQLAEIKKGLDKASGFLRRELGRRVRIHTTPQLHFVYDNSIEHGTSLSRLGGGIGTRGPGESKLEIDRRRIHDRISQTHDFPCSFV